MATSRNQDRTSPSAMSEPGTPATLPDAVAELRSERAALLGSMAAGLAHEFNNLLTVVLSSHNQLRRQPLDERGRAQLERAEWAARQAGRLAEQVLTFVRCARVEHQILDVNATVREFDKMLGHIAGDGVKLTMQLTDQPLPARLDPGQLELALLNLVRNAADAMSDRGEILVKTAERSGTDTQGQTIEVAVVDEGGGMPDAVAKRATDPFFSTKAPSRGTGLGLWMVQRFVKDCEGRMEIESAVGRGTTIRLLFPRCGD